MLFKDFELAKEKITATQMQDIKANELAVFSVSTQRSTTLTKHFQNTIQNFIASPITTLAYAITGNMHTNLLSDPIFETPSGNPTYMKSLFPTDSEVMKIIKENINRDTYRAIYHQK